MKKEKVFILEFVIWSTLDMSDCWQQEPEGGMEGIGCMSFDYWQPVAIGTRKALEERAARILEIQEKIERNRNEKYRKREELERSRQVDNHKEKEPIALNSDNEEDEEDEEDSKKYVWDWKPSISKRYRIRQLPCLN